MAAVSHKRGLVRLVQTADPAVLVLLHPLTGETFPVPRGSRILWGPRGWGELERPGEAVVYVKDVLDRKIMVDENGSLYQYDAGNESIAWFSALWKQHIYSSPELVAGAKTRVLEAARLALPRHGQQVFWSLRCFQARG